MQVFDRHTHYVMNIQKTQTHLHLPVSIALSKCSPSALHMLTLLWMHMVRASITLTSIPVLIVCISPLPETTRQSRSGITSPKAVYRLWRVVPITLHLPSFIPISLLSSVAVRMGRSRSGITIHTDLRIPSAMHSNACGVWHCIEMQTMLPWDSMRGSLSSRFVSSYMSNSLVHPP